MPGEHHLAEKFKDLYKRNYKRFFIVPALAVIFCLAVLALNFVRTGELVAKGIDLRGGVVATIEWNFSAEPDIAKLESALAALPGATGLRVTGTDSYVGGRARMVALNIEVGPGVDVTQFEDAVQSSLQQQGFVTSKADYNVKVVGPAVGAAFLQTAYIALGLGFLFIGIVIYFIFRTPPVIATVVSCIFFDFLGALAVMDLMRIDLSPVNLAALLMLIGFSIDSDILITTAVLRRHEGLLMDRAFSAMKTGVTMVMAAFGSLLALFAFSGTAVLKDMTVILLGGLVFDIVHTWFTNLGVLLLISERRGG